MRSSASVILALCWPAAAVVVVTVVFSAATLSVSDLVKPRSCAMESFSALISSAAGGDRNAGCKQREARARLRGGLFGFRLGPAQDDRLGRFDLRGGRKCRRFG